MAQWEKSVRRYALKVHSPHRMNMTIEDVQQELNHTLIVFYRDWIAENGRPPDLPLIRHALKWRVKKINRDSLAKFRKALDADTCEGDLDLLPVVHMDAIEVEETNESCRALFYGLRKHLDHEQLALLWLRHGEGLTPSEIGSAVGSDNRSVSRRLYRATATARDFLATLGITDWEDVLTVRPEELFGE